MGAHTFVSIRLHFVFGISHPPIPSEMQPHLWAYMAGIAKNIGATVYAIGGTNDHAHVFIGIPPMLPAAKAVQTIKANSSRWIREQCPGFEWQEGYAAFSVSISHTDDVVAYIRNQAAHHKRRGYGEELAVMLRKAHIRAVT